MVKFRKLTADEIDVRVSTVGEKGVSLLLYKDARCDMNILDETVGQMNWQRKHSRENANCIVSIWDENKKQWIEKEDTGTESFTEKEKGLASDSFKRACFNWGIGRELYTSPFISANVETEQYNGKYVMKNKFMKFVVQSIDYTDDSISSLVIADEKGGIWFTWKKGGQKKETPEQKYVDLLKAKNMYTDILHIEFNKMSLEDKRKEFERVKSL